MENLAILHFPIKKGWTRMDVLATALETYMVSMAKFDMKSVAEIFNIAELLMA